MSQINGACRCGNKPHHILYTSSIFHKKGLSSHTLRLNNLSKWDSTTHAISTNQWFILAYKNSRVRYIWTCVTLVVFNVLTNSEIYRLHIHARFENCQFYTALKSRRFNPDTVLYAHLPSLSFLRKILDTGSIFKRPWLPNKESSTVHQRFHPNLHHWGSSNLYSSQTKSGWPIWADQMGGACNNNTWGRDTCTQNTSRKLAGDHLEGLVISWGIILQFLKCSWVEGSGVYTSRSQQAPMAGSRIRHWALGSIKRGEFRDWLTD